MMPERVLVLMKVLLLVTLCLSAQLVSELCRLVVAAALGGRPTLELDVLGFRTVLTVKVTPKTRTLLLVIGPLVTYMIGLAVLPSMGRLYGMVYMGMAVIALMAVTRAPGGLRWPEYWAHLFSLLADLEPHLFHSWFTRIGCKVFAAAFYRASRFV